MSSDLVEIEWSIMSSLEMIVKDPISIITYLSASNNIKPNSIFTIILFPITGGLIGVIGKSLKKSSDKGKIKWRIMSIIDENISGLRIIKAFNAQKYINANFNKESKNS